MERPSSAARTTETGWRRGRRLGLVAAAGGLAVVGAACLPTKPPPPPPPPPPTEAQLQITPASESFTDDFPDAGVQTKELTVTNVGGEAAGVLPDPALSLTGAGEFSQGTTDTCAGVSLAPGASCVTSVTFTASAASGTVNGQVGVSASPGGTATADLSGTMTLTQVPAIVVSPPTFVSLLAPGASTDSPPAEILIQNTGAGAATNVQLVVSTTSGEGIQEVSRTCGANGSALAASTSCSITVKWSPGLTATAQGQLSISGDNFQTIIVAIGASID